MQLKEALSLKKPERKLPPAFTFIDLFAGIGGMRIPFEEMGGHCTFSSEWDKFAQLTYEQNFGHLPDGDITGIRSKDVGAHDILLGGFPVRHFPTLD